MQTDTALYIVTPHVVPLASHLDDLAASDGPITWGLHQVLVCRWTDPGTHAVNQRPALIAVRAILGTQKAIGFMTEDCSLVHGSLTLGALFLDGAFEFKLSGLDLVSPLTEAECLPAVRRCPFPSPPRPQVLTLPESAPVSCQQRFGDNLPWLQRYRPPEVLKSGWSAITTYDDGPPPLAVARGKSLTG